MSLVFGRAPHSVAPKSVPLTYVHVDVLVVDRVANHKHTQTFRNDELSPIETTYIFPLPDGASVSGFSASFSSDGRHLDGVIERRPKAKHVFQEAVHQGGQAALLEQERPDVFQASVGNLSPGEEVIVTCEYCLELPVENGAVRLTIPSHVGRRCIPSEDDVVRSSEVFKNLQSSRVAVGACFSARVSCNVGAAGVAAVESPTHPDIAVETYSDEPHTATVCFEARSLEKDMVLRITPRDLFEPTVAWEESAEHGTHALMLSLVPKFELPMHKVEAVFVLDCSRSMKGSRMKQARRAIQIFLRSLPVGCRFNIVRFGGSFKSIWASSAPYNEENLTAATSYVDEIRADMPGTKMLDPLRSVLAEAPKDGFSRQVFVLTDGKVTNEQAVISLVQDSAHRVFALGIGHGVSTFLVKGIAHASGGQARFVRDGEELEPVCISLLRQALTPSISNLEITWPMPVEDDSLDEDWSLVGDEAYEAVAADASPGHGILSFFDPAQRDARAYRPEEALHNPIAHKRIQQAPVKPPALFADVNFSAFALYSEGSSLDSSLVVELKGDTPFGKMYLKVPLPSHAEKRHAPLVHRMAARALIRDIEESTVPSSFSQEDAQHLSLHHRVLCRSTAFVVVGAQEEQTIGPTGAEGEEEETDTQDKKNATEKEVLTEGEEAYLVFGAKTNRETKMAKSSKDATDGRREGSAAFKAKLPQVVRTGSKKIAWVNFTEFCNSINRPLEHVARFAISEFGTEGSIAGGGQLVLKGRYLPKHVESLARKYIKEFVTCAMCHSANTTLSRDCQTRLYIVGCHDCGASCTSVSIRTGYHATTRADRQSALQQNKTGTQKDSAVLKVSREQMRPQYELDNFEAEHKRLVEEGERGSREEEAVVDLEGVIEKEIGAPADRVPAAWTRHQSKAAMRMGGALSIEELEFVLRLAAFDGSFSYCKELHPFLNLDEGAILVWSQEKWGREVEDRILVTALILGLLRIRCGGMKVIWVLVAEKAVAWLTAQGPWWQNAIMPDTEALVEEASARLQAASLAI